MSTFKSARLAAATLALAACAKAGDKADTVAARADSTAAATAARTDSAAGAIGGGWAAANILGFAHVSNGGEIAQGKLASTKATSAAVKAFAKQMVSEHQAMMEDTHALAKKLGAAMDTTSGEAHDLWNDGHDKLNDLTKKDAGNDWDKDYLQAQIDNHQKTLDELQDARKNTTDADLTAMLDKAIPKVQAHLDKAKSVKDALK